MCDYTANQVADYFLSFCREHGDFLTNLKLQKIVYYAQAWHLALLDKPLFDDKIEAWVHGPVIKSVYNRFKLGGASPITDEVKMPTIDSKTVKFLDKIFAVFGRFSAWELEQMTHLESPWIKARGGIAIDEPCNNVISIEEMKSFYRKLAKSK
jgi:uncharacterized phage-associated protein